MNPLEKNAQTIAGELQWFEQVVDTALKLYFRNETEHASIYACKPPDLEADDSTYARIVKGFDMSYEERLILILALVPHVRPQVLDVLFTKNEDYGRGFTEFGGITGSNHGGFLPTGETAAFLLAANSLPGRFTVQHAFGPSHFFTTHRILRVESPKQEPLLSGPLVLSNEYLSYLTTGLEYTPHYGNEFPAKRLTTGLEWDDLVLESHILSEVNEIKTWLQHHEALQTKWGLGKTISPGFKCLFYGPSGTGKTLTASLLGKETGYEVYRVDLSMVISKYIGETEKNLARVFDQAEHRRWLLFFDEADALFGKRSQTRGANDRYANQEVAYLLQRIEEYPGVVILATNLETNVDEAFMRRFHSWVHFTLPDAQQRLRLWRKLFLPHMDPKQEPLLADMARKYELAAGALVNVLRYGAIQAAQRGDEQLDPDDLQAGVRREFHKLGRTVN